MENEFTKTMASSTYIFKFQVIIYELRVDFAMSCELVTDSQLAKRTCNKPIRYLQLTKWTRNSQNTSTPKKVNMQLTMEVRLTLYSPLGPADSPLQDGTSPTSIATSFWLPPDRSESLTSDANPLSGRPSLPWLEDLLGDTSFWIIGARIIIWMISLRCTS